jgi:endonuclease III related protein
VILRAVYGELLACYGPQNWWPTRTGSPWEIMLGAVLTQRTSWANVELSLENVFALWGEAGLTDPQVVLDAPYDALIEATRPAGFHTSKPQRLKNLARYVLELGGPRLFVNSSQPTAMIRRELLALQGIGPETADAILLYALHRPVFVADAYALRLAARWGLLPLNASYDVVQALFMDNLPHDALPFNEYHALIVAHAKATCRSRPYCERCPFGGPMLVDRVQVGGRAGNERWQCPRRDIGDKGEALR